MTTNLRAIKINEKGIPCNGILISDLFGHDGRFFEFRQGEVYQWLLNNAEHAHVIPSVNPDYSYDFQSWEITKEMAIKAFRELNPTKYGTDSEKFEEWEYEEIEYDIEMDQKGIFVGGKVYVYKR
jgi:hypothetical protein